MLVSLLLWQIVVGIVWSDSASASSNNVDRLNNNIHFDNFRELKPKENGPNELEPNLTLIQTTTENGNEKRESPEQTHHIATKDGEGKGDKEKNLIKELRQDTNSTMTAGFSAATLSFSACEKLDMALEFMTSLDFQEHFQKVFSFTNPYDPEMLASESDFYNYVYILQLISTPIFIVLLLFGANLFLYTFVVCAAVVGLFVVFDGVEGVLPIQLDCPMKLALSVIASSICALIATTFFRTGLFAFGSLAFGGATYVVFDAFPQLDPGTIIFTPNNVTVTANVDTQHLLPTSDLSAVAWFIAISFSIIGGIVLRYFELAVLEIMTAGMGGVGCAYSLHTFFMVQGKPLDPSVVLLLAFFISLLGLRFQRRHRNLGVVQQKYTEKCSPAITWLPNEQQKQLEESMRSLLESQPKQQTHDGPSSKDMLELTITMNRFMDAMEEGKKKEEKDIDKSQ